MDEFVLTRHNVTGATWLCPAGAVREWAAIGWEPVTDGDAPPDISADTAAEIEPAAPAAPAPVPASKSRGAATTSTEGS
jgi:hypothetical protein